MIWKDQFFAEVGAVSREEPDEQYETVPNSGIQAHVACLKRDVFRGITVLCHDHSGLQSHR